jgi:membrane-bound lytic murein transglycosylase F
MSKLPYVAFVAATMFVVGCTPSGETFVRRSEGVAGGSKQIAGDSASSLIGGDVHPWVDRASQSIIFRYGSVIKKYSQEYGFDWRLILAVMKQESRFSIHAESHRGASGLMQIMPLTGDEVARDLDMGDVAHPRNNIRAGVFYLRKLYNLFEGAEQADRIKLTLAAYNAGAGRVYDAQVLADYFHDNSLKWEAIRDAFPLLSKRYYTLHRNVWAQAKPKFGYFGNSNETIGYVDKIMDYYDEYRLVLN